MNTCCNKIMASNNDQKAQLLCVIYIRKFICVLFNNDDQAYEVQEQLNRLPFRTSFIDIADQILAEQTESHEMDQFKKETLWILANLCMSKECCKEIVGANRKFIQSFRTLIQTDKDDLRDQILWTVGNLVGEKDANALTIARGLDVISFMKGIILQERALSKTAYDTICWITTNLCALEESFQMAEFHDLCCILDSISFSAEAQSIRHALHGLRQLSDTKNEERLIMIAHLGCVGHLMSKIEEHMNFDADTFVKIIGNLASCADDKVLTSLLELDLLQKIPLLLAKAKNHCVVEIAWLLSNIAAGNFQQIAFLFQHSNLIELIFKWANGPVGSVPNNVKLEATFAICNLITGSNEEGIMLLLEKGALQTITANIYTNRPKLVKLILDSMETIFLLNRRSEDPSKLLQYFVDECNGIAALEQVSQSPTFSNSEKAQELLQNYFCNEQPHQDLIVNTGFGNNNQMFDL